VKYSTGVNDPDPENDQVGLDTEYPYGGIIASEPTWNNGDSPKLTLQNGNSPIASSAQMQHEFHDTFMYQPPNGQWVPLGIFSWSTDGSATIPSTNNWANYVTPLGSDFPEGAGTVSPSSGAFTASNFFPVWGVKDVFPAF
jgi:hypothetical protein